MNKKLSRWAFVLVWFVCVPLALTALTISLLSSDAHTIPSGFAGRVLSFVSEQKVPAIIVFFTIFEALIYGFRYSLPMADVVGIAGRPGLPKAQRRDYEQAGQLLDEVNQVLKKHRDEINKRLSVDAREQLDAAMQGLANTMDAKTFSLSEFEAAYDHAGEMAAKHLSAWQRGEVREYTESIIIAVGVALLLRAFVVEAFKIPSGSMLPTLQISDHIFVNKFTYGPTIPFSNKRFLSDLPPDRADVVVFEFPDENKLNPRQNFIKRAIAFPGDILETRGGHPIINGWEVPSCQVGTYVIDESTGYPQRGELFVEYLGDYTYLTLYENYDPEDAEQREGPYHVAENEFWVLGDNRNSSSDSRRWRQGRGAGVPFENVKGRALFVWLSFNDQGTDFMGVTWDRLFTNVMGKPRLPKEASPELTKAIERCLTERPANTTPPAPSEAQLQAAFDGKHSSPAR